ncbi:MULTISPECIES: GNAT family N-acetyltransferase [Actinomadura]|uniref:GNAT family protein n=1 Tax=Actinomadura yumaensis TaxID=111807 RepID=A0ABW2CZW1_9ACTN|nr:GNAT family protein [Actinomadura sp. J1-007]
MSDFVALRPAREDDLAMLERFLEDVEVAAPFEWFGWWDVGRWRRRWAEDGLLSEGRGLLVVERNGERLGFVGWSKVVTSQISYCWRFGIGLLPEARGHGYGTEAQRLLVRYLFAHTQVARIEAVTEMANVPEQRALEKAGLVREGVMRDYAFRNGRWRDAVLFSVLRKDVLIEDAPLPERPAGRH